MVLGVSVFHILVLFALLANIALPFVQVVHARHARSLIIAILGVTIILFVLFLLLSSHASNRSDLVLFRCYAFSSSLCSVVDELFSARDAEKSMRFLIFLPLALLLLLAFACLIGGISGTF